MARIASMKNSEFVRGALERAAVVRKGPRSSSGGERPAPSDVATLAPRLMRDHVSRMEPRAVFRLCYVALVARNGRSGA